MVDSLSSIDRGNGRQRLTVAFFFQGYVPLDGLFDNPAARPIQSIRNAIQFLCQRVGDMRRHDSRSHFQSPLIKTIVNCT
jgi:hypothetical protein